jgi:FkbM family methyltransferase
MMREAAIQAHRDAEDTHYRADAARLAVATLDREANEAKEAYITSVCIEGLNMEWGDAESKAEGFLTEETSNKKPPGAVLKFLEPWRKARIADKRVLALEAEAAEKEKEAAAFDVQVLLESKAKEAREAKEGGEATASGSGAGVKRDRADAGGGGTKKEGRNAALVAAAANDDDNDYDDADADDDTRRTSAGKRCRTLDNGGPCLEMPSGLVFEYLSRDEAVFLHNEIFTQDSYFHPDGGIALYADSTVIDVGANLGLFTLRCAAEAERVRTLAFEPIRATFEVMRRNVAHLPLVQPRRLALGQAAAESVVFESYQDMPGEATRYPLERSAQRAVLLHAAQVRTHASVGQAGTAWDMFFLPRPFFPPLPASLPSSSSFISSFFTPFLPSSPRVSPFVLVFHLLLLHVLSSLLSPRLSLRPRISSPPSSRLFFPFLPASLPSSSSFISSFFTSFSRKPVLTPYPPPPHAIPRCVFSMIHSPNKHSKRTHPWRSLLRAALNHCCPCPCLTRRNQRMGQWADSWATNHGAADQWMHASAME